MSGVDYSEMAGPGAVRGTQHSAFRMFCSRFPRPILPESETSRFLLYSVVVLVLFSLLSVFRLSTASLPFSSDGTDDARVLVNSVRMTRSDDFLRGIPRWLSFQQGGSPDSILDYSNSPSFLRATSTPFLETLETKVLLPDEIIQKAIGGIAPLEIKFAIREWFVYLRIFLVLPLFFKLVGLSFRIGVIAAVALSMTPLSLWLGGSAAAMTASVLLPLSCVALFFRTFFSTVRFRKSGLVLLALYTATTSVAAIDYPPWKWPLLFIFGCLMFSTLVNRHGFGLLRPLIILALPVCGYQGFRWAVYSDQFSAVLDTVYPGKRRASGGGGYGNVMSGSITWLMQTTKSKAAGTVNPEFAFGLNALIWPVFLLAPLLLQNRKEDLRRRALLITLLPTGIIILWVTATWPEFLLKFNPLVFVTTDRAGQILGVVALLLFLIVAEIRPSLPLASRVSLGLLGAAIVTFQSLPDSLYWLGYFYKQFPTGYAWLSVCTLAFCVFIFFLIKQNLLACIPVVLFLIFSSIGIQPITVGLGPLVNSPLAKEIRQIKETSPAALWGSDPFWGDAVVAAQGVRMISGQQPLGPNTKAWKRLDASEEFKGIWNRGQSYVHFIWDRNEPSIRMSNPSPDVISVVVSPCSSLLRHWKLKYVVTEQAPGPCMTALFSGMWMGKNVSIYEIHR